MINPYKPGSEEWHRHNRGIEPGVIGFVEGDMSKSPYEMKIYRFDLGCLALQEGELVDE